MDSYIFSNQRCHFSEDFAKQARRSKADVIEWMGSLQDTFVPLGIARKRALELSQGLVKLGVDVASFQNKTDADVIHTFTRALTGERESLCRVELPALLEHAVERSSSLGGALRRIARVCHRTASTSTSSSHTRTRGVEVQILSEVFLCASSISRVNLICW